MSRYKKYIEDDVLTAARERMRHIYDIFDSVKVMFSGGKDSLVCLLLAKEVHEERGLGPVRVAFRDEELIPDVVVQTVKHYMDQPWVDLTWYAVPLKGDKFVLGEVDGYVQWDPNRPHVREKPPWSVTQEDLGLPPDMVLDQYSMDALASQDMKGLCGFITGIRSDESLIRFRACVNKLNENYIVGSGAKNVKLCRPIYDWSEADIFKFIIEGKHRYCSLYDIQNLSGMGLRVSTPIHSESAKRIAKWRQMDPDFYQRILKVFPEMELQERYWKEYNEGARIERDSREITWDDCEALIEEKFKGNMKKLAYTRMRDWRRDSKKDPEKFTPLGLYKKLQSGTVKRNLLPDL